MKSHRLFTLAWAVLLAILVNLGQSPSHAQSSPDDQYNDAQDWLSVSFVTSHENSYHPNYDTVPTVFGGCKWNEGTSVTGMAYCWGGFDNVSTFLQSLANDEGAGANQVHGASAPSWAAGIDCSGFISQLWQLPSKEGTTGLGRHAFLLPTDKFTEYPIRRGDIWLSSGAHVAWVVDHLDWDGTVSTDHIYEAAGWQSGNKVRSTTRVSKPFSSAYRCYRFDIVKPQVGVTGPATIEPNAAGAVEWKGTVNLTDNASYEVTVKFQVINQGTGSIVFEQTGIVQMQENSPGSMTPKPGQSLGGGAIVTDGSGQLQVIWRGEGRNGGGNHIAKVTATDLVGIKTSRNPAQGPQETQFAFELKLKPGGMTGTVNTSASINLSGPSSGSASGTIFTFGNLPEGSYSLAVSAPNYLPQTKSVSVRSGETATVSITLLQGKGSLRVTVKKTNADGQVVNAQGVQVTIDGPTMSQTKTTGWGSASGKALFSDIPVGTYLVTVPSLNYSQLAQVVQGQTTDVQLGP